MPFFYIPTARRFGACSLLAVLTTLTACDPAPPPQTDHTQAPVKQIVAAHLPAAFSVGRTFYYRIDSEATSHIAFYPPLSRYEPRKSPTEFGLRFEVVSVDNDQVTLGAQVDYVAAKANLAFMEFTIDTRQPHTLMDAQPIDDYELVHPGLEDVDHPLNAGWKRLKSLTEEPFQVQLDADGGFISMKGYAPRTDEPDSLNLLAPNRLATMLCMMFPPHQPATVKPGTQWNGRCDAEPVVFDIIDTSTNRAIYEAKFGHEKDGTRYTSYIRGNAHDALASAKLALGQSYRKDLNMPGIGSAYSISTLNIDAQITLQKP
ncbi:hypothetical protein [Pseudomonas sp. Marseille-QA0892]